MKASTIQVVGGAEAQPAVRRRQAPQALGPHQPALACAEREEARDEFSRRHGQGRMQGQGAGTRTGATQDAA